jgi:hypothetical protein
LGPPSGGEPARVVAGSKTNSQCLQPFEKEGYNERIVAISRKNTLFAGSDGGARHWAIAMTLIQTAKLNGREPMAYLTDVLQRIVSGQTKAHELYTLLPWAWTPEARADLPPQQAIAA